MSSGPIAVLSLSHRNQVATVRSSGVSSAQAVVHLILTVTLVAGIVAAATAVSIGIARAQSATGLSEPDTSLVIAMLAAAIAVMVVLSALAVRLTGRPRQR